MHHHRPTASVLHAAAMSLSLLAFVSPSVAQGLKAPTVSTPGDTGPVESPAGDASAPEWMKRLKLAPDSPAAKVYAEQAKSRKQVEKDLRKLRFAHFGRIRQPAVRQEGLVTLRTYSSPALFPLLIEIFGGEEADVRTALLELFRDAKNDQGDAALAWMAVRDERAESRAAATAQLARRLAEDHASGDQVKFVIFEAMRSGRNETMLAGAQLASNLNLIDVMPWLISSQVVGQPTQQVVGSGASGSRDGALAWIMVGQQTAFVSDLIPVVGPNAVAFDPQLSVINTGVILRVIDAAVVTYHVDIHNALVDWSTREMGESTGGLGFNIPAWRTWYEQTFLPHMAEKASSAEERRKASRPATPASNAPLPSTPAGTPGSRAAPK